MGFCTDRESGFELTERQGTGAPVNGQGFLLPDLCAPQSVLLVVLVAELLALSLVLYAGGHVGFDWAGLGRTSLFVQWLALSSAACLCVLRGWLARQPLVLGASAAYGLILLLCLLFSLAAQMLLVELDWFDLRPNSGQVLRNLLLCAVLAGITLRYFHLQAQLQRRQRAEMQARIEALHSRIRPHFLFNTMNSIASLIAEDPDAAERAVEDLAALFRVSLREVDSEVDIRDEIDLCQRYLGIEAHRLGERLSVNWQIAELPAGVRVPSLSLQPLLENAIYHGVQPLPQGGEIRIEIGIDGADLEVRISNPLAISTSAEDNGQGHHMALENIRDRLEAIYGDDAELRVERSEETFLAVMRCPAGRRS